MRRAVSQWDSHSWEFNSGDRIKLQMPSVRGATWTRLGLLVSEHMHTGLGRIKFPEEALSKTKWNI